MDVVCRIVTLVAFAAVALFAPAPARAGPAPRTAAQPATKNDVTQVISIDGKPAGHVLATLFNCQTGVTVAGPIETDERGYVRWLQVQDSQACIRVTRAVGSGSAPAVIDHAAQPVNVDVTLSPATVTGYEYALPWVLCAGCVLLVAVPILQFLMGPWADRREKIMAILAGEPLRLYYQKFRANVPIVKEKVTPDPARPRVFRFKERLPSDNTLADWQFNSAFARDFGRWYGIRYYILPLLILVSLTGCCAVWGVREAQGWIDGTRTIDSMAGLCAAALTGAFMWVISDEIDRLRRHDFTTSDLYYYIFRILLSIPFAWAITRLQVTLQVGIPTAIFLGAFPTTSLLTIARRIGNQQLKLGDDPGTGLLELEKLQSVGKTNAERFKEVDISNIGQLTRADPVDLAIRTNFDFDYISDCVNEALLWVYVGPELGKLAVYSVRGACEARRLLEDCKSMHQVTQARARQTVKDIVAAFVADDIPISEDSLLATLFQAGYDPYTEFLDQIWH